jgi:predicted DNA-binding transcriptional regulator YafY
MRNDQLIRQWEILWSLVGPPGRTIKAMAEEYEVSERTIQRDLEALEAAGYPLVDEEDSTSSCKEKRWRLIQSFNHLPPIPMTREEAFAVLAAAQTMRGLDKTPIGEAFRSVLTKLRKAIKPLELEMTTLSGTYIDDPDIERNYAGHRDTINLLLKALHRRQLLDIRYHAAHTDEVTERTVAPLCFWKSGGELYLIAHCYMRNAPRSFRVDRFVSVKPSAEKLPWPEGFDPVNFLRHSFGPWVGEPKEVVLEFPVSGKDHFDKVQIHPTQQIRTLKGGGVEVRLKVAPSLNLAQWLAGFGRDVRVVAPPELREWVLNLHRGGMEVNA